MDPRGADVNGSKLIFPGLADFYARMEPIAYTITRVVFGFIMIMHGWPKWTRGAEAIGNAFANNYGLPRWFAPLAIFFEVVGGFLEPVVPLPQVTAPTFATAPLSQLRLRTT